MSGVKASLYQGEWFQLAVFVVVQFADDVRDVYAKKTAEEITAEGNCQQFFRGRQYE